MIIEKNSTRQTSCCSQRPWSMAMTPRSTTIDRIVLHYISNSGTIVLLNYTDIYFAILEIT
jgi:hypothetical protein